MTDLKALADELEALSKGVGFSFQDDVTFLLMVRDNLPAILSALRRVDVMTAALAERDAAMKGLPCETGAPIGYVCPHCGATADEVCRRSVRADDAFVIVARQALTGEA